MRNEWERIKDKKLKKEFRTYNSEDNHKDIVVNFNFLIIRNKVLCKAKIHK